MINPIDPILIVATPDSAQALWSYCEKFTGDEKLVAITCAALAWNLAHKLVQEQIEGEAK